MKPTDALRHLLTPTGAGAISTAVQAPQMYQRTENRYNKTLGDLTAASMSPLGEYTVTASLKDIDEKSPEVKLASESWFKVLMGEKVAFDVSKLLKKTFPKGSVAESVAKGVGGGLVTAGGMLLLDIAAKAKAAISESGNKQIREAILDKLKKEDLVLGRAKDEDLLEAYDTMVKFAPTLSTDKNAVKSFLREAVMSGGGVNVNTIKLLADAERSATQQHDGKR